MLNHWTDRQKHLARLGLTTPEGWPRPNAPQYLRQMNCRGCMGGFPDDKPAAWFKTSGSFGICYRLRCNRNLKLTEVLWQRMDESREILKACIKQCKAASKARAWDRFCNSVLP